MKPIDTIEEGQIQMTTMCPECAAELEVADSIVGEIVQCTDCSSELEVLSTVPLELGLAPAEEEDWGE